MQTSDQEHPFRRPYASGRKTDRLTQEDLNRGRKRRAIDIIAEDRELGEELMEFPWDDEY